jgi:hypothetical protein
MSVSYVSFQITTGQFPVTTPAYTPGAGGNQLVFLTSTSSGTGLSFTLAGSGTNPSTFINQPVSSLANFSDGVSGSYSLWDSLSCAAGSQTVTISQPSGDYTYPMYLLEFSGAVSIKNPVYTITANPGAGLINGQSFTVATGDILVAHVYDATNQYATACTVNGPSSPNAITGYSASVATYWHGTGGAMQPTYTPNSSYQTDTYILIQYVMSATSSSGGGVSLAWIT